MIQAVEHQTGDYPDMSRDTPFSRAVIAVARQAPIVFYRGELSKALTS